MFQAQIKSIESSLLISVSPIQIHWNRLAVEIAPDIRTSGKYKKVNIESKQALLNLVRNGSSIISAARILNINYSTAKSIFQNIKAKALGKLKRKRYIETDSEPTSEAMKEEHHQST